VQLRRLLELYAPQPRATMPLGVRVNDVIYAGNVTGADVATGEIAQDLEAQFNAALSLLRQVIEAGGGSITDVRHVEASVADQQDGELIETSLLDSLRGATVEASPSRLPPGQLLRLDAIASTTPDVQDEIAIVRIGSTVVASQISGVLFSAAITATDPETGELPDGIEAQMDAAFRNLDATLQAASTDSGSVLRIGGYLRDLSQKDVLNGAMVRRFPDPAQKPVHKYVPAALPAGVEVALQFLARLDAPRRIIEIPGIVHNDPISLGAIAGNLFVTSRVQGRLEATAIAQAERLIQQHARTLMTHVGGELRHVTQTTWGIGDPAYAVDIASAMQRAWPVAGPDLRVIEADFPHSPLPRLEFIAVLD
jgi:2-iminobutanoate/2-iminopropanoate deaminase